MTDPEVAIKRNQAPSHETFLQTVSEDASIIAHDAIDNGAIATIARVKLEADPDLKTEYQDEWLAPATIFDVVLKAPKPAQSHEPRFELIASLKKAIGETADEHAQELLGLAVQTGMRRNGEHEDYSSINPAIAKWIVESGANKTSVVRRAVAETAMHSFYGENLSTQTLHQFGGKRTISPVRVDGSPNPEHAIIRSLAGDFLPTGEFTEFDANLATALADGYKIVHLFSDNSMRSILPPSMVERPKQPLPSIEQIVTLAHSDTTRPQLLLIQPANKALEGGLDAIKQLVDLDGAQFVIATNGQYRPKGALQAFVWAKRNNITMATPVALGDEPGDESVFKGETLVTPARPAEAYVNELVLYGRQSAGYFVEFTNQTYNLPGAVIREEDGGDTHIVVEPNGREWASRKDNVYYPDPEHPGFYD